MTSRDVVAGFYGLQGQPIFQDTFCKLNIACMELGIDIPV